MKNFLTGFGLAVAVVVLVSAAQEDTPAPKEDPLMLALQRIAAAQERQAAAWEKGMADSIKIQLTAWPSFGQIQLRGGFPR